MRTRIGILASLACLAVAAETPKPQGCDEQHFRLLGAYLKQYGNHEPDRVDIERFITLNHRLCERIIDGRMSEAEAGAVYRREVEGLADRVRRREIELLREAGRLAAG